MFRLFHEVNIDWLGKRRFFIGLSILLMLAGMGTAFYCPPVFSKGTHAFYIRADFKGGTVVTARFKQPPSVEALRAAIQRAGVGDAVIQPVLDRQGEFLIKVPQQGPAAQPETPQAPAQTQVGVDPARAKLGQAMKTF